MARKPSATIDKRFSRWIRKYIEALHDPKIVNLTDHQYRAWDRLLLIAGKTNDGALPGICDIAADLRCTIPDAQAMLDELIMRGLFDLDGGTPGHPIAIRPHNWDMRQYAAKTSAERMRKHRSLRASKKRSVGQRDVTCDDKVTICSESVSSFSKKNANSAPDVTTVGHPGLNSSGTGVRA